MSLFAISDLHLSLGSSKPMDVFGELWRDHHLKVMENWNNKVKSEDTVLVAGDLSWALKHSEAQPDLAFIHNLNGKKILLKGNHDYWWGSISKLNSLFEDMFFIQNNHSNYKEYGICGTRGWISIDGTETEDEKVYKREIIRLRMSLESAHKAGFQKLMVMMHYPPMTRISKSPEFLDLLDEFQVERLIYGHVHIDAKAICINGQVNGTEFLCTSADIIHFDPVPIILD